MREMKGMADSPGAGKAKPGGFLGSLKEALAAASRDDTALAVPKPAATPAAPTPSGSAPPPRPASPPPLPASQSVAADANLEDLIPQESDLPPAAPHPSGPKPLSAAQAAREARGVTSLKPQEKHMEFDGTNTTRIVRGGPKASGPAEPAADESARTQLVRGRQPLKRGQFVVDPVVGWLVVTGGPGLGAYRPVFEGNNAIGRSPDSRIPIDFGDEAISSEEQAYIRYDSNDRGFLFVPNMSKTNVVSVNNKRPTSAVELAAMDVIVMGRTQLVFMPFCGQEFDWSEISETKD